MRVLFLVRRNISKLPQQFSFAQDWIVDRMEGLEADFEVLDPHVGQLLSMGLLYPSNHCLVGQMSYICRF